MKRYSGELPYFSLLGFWHTCQLGKTLYVTRAATDPNRRGGGGGGTNAPISGQLVKKPSFAGTIAGRSYTFTGAGSIENLKASEVHGECMWGTSFPIATHKNWWRGMSGTHEESARWKRDFSMPTPQTIEGMHRNATFLAAALHAKR
jgi:hypothetical protein